MTEVRLYVPADEQPFRDMAARNYAEQCQDTLPTDREDPAVAAYLSHLVQIQSSGKGIILVAEQDDRLTGFVCLLKPDNSTAGNDAESSYAFMSDLFVVPECRSLGVGSALTRALEEQARLMGAASVALRVSAENPAARDFYATAQYQEKFIVMSKALSGRASSTQG